MESIDNDLRVIVRGAGEMASGVIYRLVNSGYGVIALEIARPGCVRRAVCFAEAVYEGEIIVQGVKGRLARDIGEALEMSEKNIVPVLVDPDMLILKYIKCDILVDGRMLKSDIDISRDMADLVIGLGPGFEPGVNCHMAIETNRGENLGRVLTNDSPQGDTGIPSSVEGFTTERVLRAPSEGILAGRFEIGDFVKKDDVIAEIDELAVRSEIAGVLRGICRTGLRVVKDQKIGDIDPRGRRELCFRISDKAGMIAGGVMKAVEIYEQSRVRV